MDNKGLVLYVKKALEERWGYVWGTFGQVLTHDLFAQKVRQYPNGVGNYFDFIKGNWVGRKTVDCIGLIKGYYWTSNNKLRYSGLTDVSADMMYSLATEKGPIKNIPDIQGLLVWKKGHIGVYIGHDQVIEAHGTLYGVIQTPLYGGTGWTHWIKCPYISYNAEVKPVINVNTEPAYVDAYVRKFQAFYNEATQTRNALYIDGEYGPKTKKAYETLGELLEGDYK